LRDIADDAGVTAQTLHTRFGSKDQLLIAAFWWWGQHEVERRDTAPVGEVSEAISVLFDHYEAHGTAMLRMLVQEDRSPAVATLTNAGRAYHRAWVEKTFKPLLETLPKDARQRRLAAIVVATDLLVWRLLRLDMKLDRDEAERIVAEMVQRSPSTS
jgi:AcrR family transcriptional regulator